MNNSELSLKIATHTIRKTRLDELMVKFNDGKATADEKAEIKSLTDMIKTLNAEIKDLKEIMDGVQELAQAQLDNETAAATGANLLSKSQANGGGNNGGGAATGAMFLSATLPVSCKGRIPKDLIRIKSLSDNLADAQRVAYSIGMLFRAHLSVDHDAKIRSIKWCVANGLMTKAQSENVNSQGGFLVPIELANYIITLTEQYGAARKYMHVATMTGDTKTIPRRAGAITGYWITDGGSITLSTKSWDMVTLVSKKLGAIVAYSNELSDDAMIDIGNDLAREIARVFAFMEDRAAFNGTGTALDGGVIGLSAAIQNANNNPTTTSIGGVTVGSAGSGTSWGSYTLPDFDKVQATLPGYVASMGTPGWYCSQQFFYGTMYKLAAAAGGNTMTSILEGSEKKIFLGAPVNFVEVMTLAAGASQIDCYYGDLDLSSTLGDRKEIQIATSDQYLFQNDQIAIRGISRLDINNHDVGGNGANTLAQNLQYDPSGGTYYGGPICALLSYTS